MIFSVAVADKKRAVWTSSNRYHELSSGRTYENVAALGRKSTKTYLGDINYSISVSHFSENGTQTSQSSRQHGESKENITSAICKFAGKEVCVNTGISLAERIWRNYIYLVSQWNASFQFTSLQRTCKWPRMFSLLSPCLRLLYDVCVPFSAKWLTDME